MLMSILPFDFTGITCIKLSTLRDGSIKCSDANYYKSRCSFACDEGYALYGARSTECLDNGWDAQTPFCYGKLPVSIRIRLGVATVPFFSGKK